MDKGIGVYMIANCRNGRLYVGSTCVSFSRRWAVHRRELVRGVHGNPGLQRDWCKFGGSGFLFVVLETLSGLPELQIRQHEQIWLDMMRIDGVLVYNVRISTYGGTPLGTKHSLLARRKMSVSKKGRKLSKAWRQALSDATRGKPKPASFAAQLARPHPAFRNKESGEIIEAGVNLSALCRKHGLTSSGMSAVVTGRSLSYHGWELLDVEEWIDPRGVKYPAFVNLYSGETTEPGSNLSRLCRERGLNGACMSQVLHGHRVSHKGWAVLGSTDTDRACLWGHPAFRHCDSGQIIPAGGNLAETCRGLGLDASCMAKVKNGKRRSHKGWKLLNVQES